MNLIKDLDFYYGLLIFLVNILKESKRKPNKKWVCKGSECCNSSFKKWLKDNDIEMYSTNNEGQPVLAERFIRTLKNKFINT